MQALADVQTATGRALHNE